MPRKPVPLKPISRIPDAWLGGYLKTHPDASVSDAVSHWLEQERLADSLAFWRSVAASRTPQAEETSHA